MELNVDAFAVALIVCGGTAVLALVLSMTAKQRLARQLGQIALWLTLGAAPVAIAIDLVRLWSAADDAATRATLLGRAISHAMNYGVLLLPCAALAGLALRRANTRRMKVK